MKVAREKIVSAAIRGKVNETYTLPPPNRHANIREMMQKDGIKSFTEFTDGFITDSRRFVNRLEAYKIARKANQILPFALDLPGSSLTTEHLW